MELFINHGWFRNARLTNADGEVMFRFTSRGLFRVTRTIYGRPPSSDTVGATLTNEPTNGSGSTHTGSNITGTAALGLVEIARIHFRTFHSSRIVYKGRIVNVKEFMPLGGGVIGK